MDCSVLKVMQGSAVHHLDLQGGTDSDTETVVLPVADSRKLVLLV
jgi:hypothetical protein